MVEEDYSDRTLLEKEEIILNNIISEERITIFNPSRAFDYCSNPICIIESNREKICYNFKFEKGIPVSDDDNVYLFELSTFEKENSISEKVPVAIAKKHTVMNMEIEYKDRLLFSSYIPAIRYKGEYVALSNALHISNPEILANNTDPYPSLESKKGLLLDANTIDTDKLYDLNVKRMVFNIPISILMGESTNPACQTIEYEYNGVTYLFNGYMVGGYDSLFSYLTEEGFHTTAIVLNDWNKNFPEIMHPLSRRRTGKSYYYAFNTEEEKGVRLMEAVASFLAERYSGGEYGMVHDWVIANEINQQKIWNYMGTDDLEYYTESFEKSFRTFYNAIKANYSNAHVCFSIDQDWNNNYGNNRRFFNGKELLLTFNKFAKAGGNYDWGLSIHPYPDPLNNTRFWRGDFDKSENAGVVTPMNLSVVTDMMQKDEFLNPYGKVRDISVTELGFCSKAGEKLQAAAFAYCYYIIDNNEYISSFLLNRQTDDADALKSGLALGIYNKDYSAKYIADVFKNVDQDAGEEYIEEMLNIIGAESMEEALSWAQ